MYKNGNKYDKFYRNGIFYTKGFHNGQQILGSSNSDPSLLVDIPFNGDFENKVPGGIQMVTAGNAPAFSNGAATFDGSTSIKTAAPLDMASDKLTICYWIKTTQTSLSIISELSPNFNTSNAFISWMNDPATNSIVVADHDQNYKMGMSNIQVNDGTWKFVSCVIDRGAFQNIYIDGVQNYTPLYSGTNSGNWPPEVLYLGARAGSQNFYVGEMSKFQLYNRILSDAEITAKYNAGH